VKILKFDKTSQTKRKDPCKQMKPENIVQCCFTVFSLKQTETPDPKLQSICQKALGKFIAFVFI
jgi:hypothetical protein